MAAEARVDYELFAVIWLGKLEEEDALHSVSCWPDATSDQTYCRQVVDIREPQSHKTIGKLVRNDLGRLVSFRPWSDKKLAYFHVE